MSCSEPSRPLVTESVKIAATGEQEPTLSSPRLLGTCARGSPGPVWTAAGQLVRDTPRTPGALSHTEKPGLPVFDPSSNAWYASANGTLVRIDESSLPVIADGIQGVDVDVRWSAGWAVSREPNHAIVLYPLDEQTRSAKVLMRGAAYFRPRFSPLGDRILVAESRAGGGHLWVVSLDGTARDVVEGSGGSWHPDGKRIVFTRLEHDEHTITASELFIAEVETGEVRKVGAPSVPAVDPVISPDGKHIAFIDDRTRELYLARFDDPFAKEGQ